MTFVYVGGRRCLNFVGTIKHRDSAREELLTRPELLSEFAVQGGLLDGAIHVTDDDLAAAIELREAIYRTVIARLEHRRPQPADVDLLNERAAQPQLTPRLQRTGAPRRMTSAASSRRHDSDLSARRMPPVPIQPGSLIKDDPCRGARPVSSHSSGHTPRAAPGNDSVHFR